MKKCIISLILINSWNCYGQSKPLALSFEAGITWRSTMMNVFNLRRVDAFDPLTPFDYERHVQGLSLSLGAKLYHKKSQMGIGYAPTFRYDYVHGTFLGTANSRESEKYDFLTEHHFYLFRYFKWRYKSTKNSYIGLGLASMNLGKKYWIDNKINDTLFRFNPSFLFDIQFMTIDLRYGIPVTKHWYIEPMAQLIPKTFPSNKERMFLMYSLRLLYNFKKE
jgi:hypothetical protein